jgi:hypothetical protein
MKLKTMQLEDSTKELLRTSFPEDIHKVKGSGKNAATYVSGYPVIDKLNATFGMAGWSWEIIDKWVEKSEDKITKVKWENNKKIELKKEDWIIEPQLPAVHIIGKLTVYFERPDGSIFSVVRMAPGAQTINGGQSEQENAFKGAHTDAIKKAATTFGIGLELYRNDKEQAYFEDINYEDPWTEEASEQFKEEIAFIKSFKASYELTSDDMDGYINTFSNGNCPNMDYLMPDNISDFVNYLKTLTEEQAEN